MTKGKDIINCSTINPCLLNPVWGITLQKQFFFIWNAVFCTHLKHTKGRETATCNFLLAEDACISGVQISQVTYKHMEEHVILRSRSADFLETLEDF